MKSPIFEINKVYEEDARLLLSARNTSRIVHASGDIDASGDEMEEPFREFLRGRLPSQYHVGHGHIVDRNLAVSPQLDVIISDSAATPILLHGQNGFQYFPWEAVYAVGEIKSTFKKSDKQVSGFANAIEKLMRKIRDRCFILDRRIFFQ